MSEDAGCVVRLRGLPWSAKPEEIVYFLRECKILGGAEGVHFTYSREGRPSGEAFVELESEDDVTHALAQNNEHIGNRYIEVFRVDRSEMDWMVKRAGAGVAQNQGMSDAVVKLRGLPFGCSKEEIAHFFAGLEIVPNGIMLPEDRQGRSTGEAFVQFATPEIAERALEKHKERIGHRYIEIFKSSMSEATAAGGGRVGGSRPLIAGGGLPMRPGPYDRNDRFSMGIGMMGLPYGRGRARNIKGFYEDEYEEYGYDSGLNFGLRNRRGGIGLMRGRGMAMGMVERRAQPGSCYVSRTGHSVHMRGLPFQAVEQDVFDFFSPIQPVRCEFEFGDNGRPTGEANVDFATHQEALEAMKKHRGNMQHRYIELFLNSEPNSRVSSGLGASGGGGSYGNSMKEDFDVGGGGGAGDVYGEDIVSGYGQGVGAGNGFGGGYNTRQTAGSYAIPQGQGAYGRGNVGFGTQAASYGYGMTGGYSDGLNNPATGIGMLETNYQAF